MSKKITVDASTEMMSLDDIALGLANKRLYVVSDDTGLSYPTLKKLADKTPSNYTMQTIKIVSAYIRQEKDNADLTETVAASE